MENKDIKIYSKHCKTLSELLEKYSRIMNRGAAFMFVGRPEEYKKAQLDARERAKEYLKEHINEIPSNIKKDIEL